MDGPIREVMPGLTDPVTLHREVERLRAQVVELERERAVLLARLQLVGG